MHHQTFTAMLSDEMGLFVCWGGGSGGGESKAGKALSKVFCVFILGNGEICDCFVFVTTKSVWFCFQASIRLHWLFKSHPEVSSWSDCVGVFCQFWNVPHVQFFRCFPTPFFPFYKDWVSVIVIYSHVVCQ